MTTWPSPEDVDVDGFRTDGFTGVHGLVEADEVAWLADVIDALVTGDRGRASGLRQDLAGRDDGQPDVLPQVMAPHRLAPELLDAAFLPRAAELGRRLVGDEAITSIAMVIVKPPGIGAETPWHQDAVYWDRTDEHGRPLRHRAASIWIPLQPATRANGCLEFVRGSHLRGIAPHRHLDDDPAIHAQEVLPDRLHEHVIDPIAVELPPGGASIHDGYELHRAGPNTTDQPRRALILSVRAPAVVG